MTDQTPPPPVQLDVDMVDAAQEAAAAAAAHTDWTRVAFEVIVDQTVYCPVWFLVFFTYGGIYEGRPFKDTLAHMKREMVPAVTTSWWIWVPVMTVSFGFVKPELRVPYYLVMSFAYAMLLSALWGEVPEKVTVISEGAGEDKDKEKEEEVECDEWCEAVKTVETDAPESLALGAVALQAAGVAGSGSLEVEDDEERGRRKM